MEARPDSAGVLRFVRVAEKSGHRTVRVILTAGIAESPAQRALIDAVVAMGCSFEGCNPRYLTVANAPCIPNTASGEALHARTDCRRA